MASVIVVMIIFVLLALAILFICQNGGWQGGCGGNCAGCHSKCAEAEKKPKQELLPPSAREVARNFAPLLQGELFSCPAVAQMHKNGYTYK